MSEQRPRLANIADQIGHQVLLMRQDEKALADLHTVRARLEAILHFASMGLNLIDERADAQIERRPKPKRSAAVE